MVKIYINILGIAVGSAYGCMTVSIGVSTGAALNPAKVIGPGLIGEAYFPILPYLAGILGGTLAGGILCEYILFKGVTTSAVEDEKERGEDEYEKELPSYVRENDANDDSFELRDDRDPNTEEVDLADDLDVSKVMSEVGDEDKE